ncbi:uncharacterized protein LOC132204412 [Neocloeon triangulifer]|uniref:uncharacterized protein LOC132204412 n=1 Tax=Neocloeon triangulifer TaxID=2078957 RepID=UPI00286F25AB|nr:uncharacterized protein LOC132204412 [Neocloeon triangulifer]
MMISSLKIIILFIIISLILVELTTSRVAGFCNSTILTNGNVKRLQCNFEKGRANYNTGDVRECKCNGRDCYELSHASFVCRSDSDWYFEDNNSTSEYWGVECKDEKSCPRCFIPKSDFSNCYKVKDYSNNYFACVCKHNQREYTMKCQHNGHLYIWSPLAHTKYEQPKLPNSTISTVETTKAPIIFSSSSTIQQSEIAKVNTSEPNQNISTPLPTSEKKTKERNEDIFPNEMTIAPSTLRTTHHATFAEESTGKEYQTTSTPLENEKKAWYEETSYIILAGSILAFIAFGAVAFAIFAIVKRRTPVRPIIL